MLTNFSKVSAVSPNNGPLGETLINRIRTYPATAKVIPVYDFSPFKIAIPPMFPDHPIETLAVTAEDMAYLVDLYHLELAEGRLPQPNSNEIVLPWAVAKNRDIQVGDIIGSREHPVYPDAPTLPIELVVSGIFAPAETHAEETWLSFMSLEFVDAYRETDLSLIVVSQPGQKVTLDGWLENSIASDDQSVYTYHNQQIAFQKEMKSMLITFSLMVGIILLVAILVLAGLLYIFVSQRTVEFGILNALGFRRRQLTGRIVRETLFASGTAWVAAVAVCLLVLYALQRLVFDPVGLRFEYFSLTPWLFTLPAPAAMLLVAVSITNSMLSRLDPISIIERRM
jgi:ABC-type lipoprotein release transport system permease subunit